MYHSCTTQSAEERSLGEAVSRFPEGLQIPANPLAMGTGLKLRELLGTEFKPAESELSCKPGPQGRAI